MDDPSHVVTVPVSDGKPVPVWFTTDWHIGHEAHADKLLDGQLLRAEKEGWRANHLGDGPEQVGAGDKVAGYGALWTQKLPPIEQRKQLAQMVSRVKFDILFPGNHDRRVDAKHGISYVETVVDKANLLRAERGDPHRSDWMARPGFLTYRLVRTDGYAPVQEYVFFLHHGEGPVINPFTLLSRIQSRVEGVDAILTGHTHELAMRPIVVRGPGRERTVLWMRCGHYLSNPDYAATRPITTEGAAGSILLWLHTDQHKITPELLLGA